MKKLKMYISGTITDNPTYVEDFANASDKYRKLGYEVCNPVEIDEAENVPADADWRWYLRSDLDNIWKPQFDVILVLSDTLKKVDKAYGTLLEITMGEKYGAEIRYEEGKDDLFMGNCIIDPDPRLEAVLPDGRVVDVVNGLHVPEGTLIRQREII